MSYVLRIEKVKMLVMKLGRCPEDWKSWLVFDEQRSGEKIENNFRLMFLGHVPHQCRKVVYYIIDATPHPDTAAKKIKSHPMLDEGNVFISSSKASFKRFVSDTLGIDSRC